MKLTPELLGVVTATGMPPGSRHLRRAPAVSGAARNHFAPRRTREALAKAAQFLEEGHRDVIFKDLPGKVLDRSVVVTMAEIED